MVFYLLRSRAERLRNLPVRGILSVRLTLEGERGA